MVGDEYEVLEQYKDNNTKIKILHKKCEETYYTTPANFLSGKRCKKCYKKKCKTHEEFISKVKERHNDEYIVLEQYKSHDTDILVQHNSPNCNFTIFKTKPTYFFNNQHSLCPKCMKIIFKDTNYFKNEVYNLVQNEYSVLEEYINAYTKILFKHNICDYEWYITPSNFLRGKRCPQCSKLKRKNTDIFKKEVYDLVKDEYIVLEEYLNAHTKILFKHMISNCNYFEFLMTPNTFLQGSRCIQCKESKGEQKIRNWCTNNNIIYEYEFKFLDLLSDLGNPLRFDFAIFKDEEKIKLECLIEFDGEFHYKKIYENNYYYETLQYHDQLKNQYCNNKNIKLIRIPYWEFDNLEEILKEKILYKTRGEKI